MRAGRDKSWCADRAPLLGGHLQPRERERQFGIGGRIVAEVDGAISGPLGRPPNSGKELARLASATPRMPTTAHLLGPLDEIGARRPRHIRRHRAHHQPAHAVGMADRQQRADQRPSAAPITSTRSMFSARSSASRSSAASARENPRAGFSDRPAPRKSAAITRRSAASCGITGAPALAAAAELV